MPALGYYPFGMRMPNRGAGGVSYRYGFNGKETENDVKGIGNEQDYGMRIYDPRLGRFLSVDPLATKFPELTPFQFASNTPIRAIDLDGLEAAILSYGYRVSAIFITGSVSIGAGVDHTGTVKVFTSWSAGLGLGMYAGGGFTAAIYPNATMNQVMGDGLNFGANIGVPGVSFGLDINASVQQDEVSKKYNDVKYGIGGGLKAASLGPGGAEIHAEYSNTTELFTFNVNNITQDVYDKIKEVVDLTDDQIKNFINQIVSVEETLKKLKVDINQQQSASQQVPKNQASENKKLSNHPSNQQRSSNLPKAQKKQSPKDERRNGSSDSTSKKKPF